MNLCVRVWKGDCKGGRRMRGGQALISGMRESRRVDWGREGSWKRGLLGED